LKNVISTGHAYGVRLVEAGNSVTSIEIEGGSFSGNNVGLHIPTTVTVSEITVTDTIFEDNMVGWNAEASKDAKPNLSELQITGAVFRNNSTKGFYTERLSNAVLENL